jgi:hypothetical protein
MVHLATVHRPSSACGERSGPREVPTPRRLVIAETVPFDATVGKATNRVEMQRLTSVHRLGAPARRGRDRPWRARPPTQRRDAQEARRLAARVSRSAALARALPDLPVVTARWEWELHDPFEAVERE